MQSAGIRAVTCVFLFFLLVLFVLFALHSSILDLKLEFGIVTTLHPYWVNMVGVALLFEHF